MNIQLRNTLLANGGFSLVSGTLMIVHQTWISEQVGLLESRWMAYLGIGLIAFSLFVFNTIRIKSTRHVISIILGDWGWVASTGLMLIYFWTAIPTTGKWMIDLVGLVVASFAMLQNKYLTQPMDG